jgi:UDPglucose--hexose-1-phosphate uridylyltransferase
MAREMLPGFVWNPLLGEYLVDAPGRMNRREGAQECAFCGDVARGIVPEGANAWVRPNDFPPLRPPSGECFIVMYSREHHKGFAELPGETVVEVITIWEQLTRDLHARYACTMIFENSGAAIGQTQMHPHGQAYGVAVVPPIVAREWHTALEAERTGGSCPFCTVLNAELAGPRLLYAGEAWAAFIPPYARYPYEVHIYARAHAGDLPALQLSLHPEVKRELAELLLTIVRAYHRLFDEPMPYMMALHQLADPRYHLHFELLPVARAPGKLKFAASGETAFGFWVNDSLPDEKAAELRAVMAAMRAI